MGTRELQLSSRHDAAAQARREVATCLSGTDLAHLTNDAQLVVSELVSNALLHGAPPIRLSIDVGSDRVRVAVSEQVHRDPRGEIQVTLAVLAEQIHAFPSYRPDRRARINGHERRDGHG